MAGAWRDATVALRATQWRCAAAVDKLALWLRGATQLPVLMLPGTWGTRPRAASLGLVLVFVVYSV